MLTRCRRISGVDEVVCAIPDTPENSQLGRVAKGYGPVFRGSELDVLQRYWRCAVLFEADIIMRITGDCPLISPQLCGAVLAQLINQNADYASNIEPRTFPKGLDCEVFTIGALAVKEDPDEHVTTWMRNSRIVNRVNVSSPWPIDGRLCLDTEDDYKVICAAFGHEPYVSRKAA